MNKFILALAFLVLYAGVSKARVICYFTSWTYYNPDQGQFQASDVDPHLCSHINYAFVGLQEDGRLQVLDDWEATGLFEIDHLISLKKQNPDLKVVLSMGGWNEDSQKYSTVAADPALRKVMVDSVMEFVNNHTFDGFDLDWEYPNQQGGKPEDTTNFITLLQELKAALNAEGKILSAAVAGGIASSDISFPDKKAVTDNLDMVNVMTYDFHGGFENFVGHHAPLHASHLDQTEEQKELNVGAGIKHWVDGGADPAKLNLGLGLYGRSFTLADPAENNLYDPTVGQGGDAGPWTRQIGILGYNEICWFHNERPYIWDDEQMVPHRVLLDQWVGYDDAKSLKLKVEYAKSLGVGGMMVWSLDTDDFLNLCGEGKYPLLTAVNEALEN